MANITVLLPVPSANGAGAAVDVTTFGGLKTCIVSRGTANGDISITIEFSNDAGALFWAPLRTVQGSGIERVTVAARWMRATVQNYKFGNPADVQVGGVDEGTLLVSLPVPAGNGFGAAVDISALGIFKTAQVGGSFRGNLSVEFSQDGVAYGEFMSLQQPGYRSDVAAAQWARVRRNGVPQVAPGTPVCNLGGTTDGTGGGGGSGNELRFSYTVTGAEPDLSELTILIPGAPRFNATYQVGWSQGTATALLEGNIDNASRTTTQFVLTLSAEATAGDVFWFTVADPS